MDTYSTTTQKVQVVMQTVYEHGTKSENSSKHMYLEHNEMSKRLFQEEQLPQYI